MYDNGFEISIDLKPKVPFEQLDERVNKLLRHNGKTSIKNIFKELLPSSMIIPFFNIINLDPYITGAQINKEQRQKIVSTLKDIRFKIIDSEGYQRAVVNTGGIELKEIDPNTMKSKIFDNLYFIGDILDIFGPTGGFNLQVCWSTAYTAIESLKKG
jgi:hypothetical protein